MRVPISWLREYAPIPEPYDALEVGRRLTLAGLEVEAVELVGGAAEQDLARQRVLVVEVRVVLPGEADPAVQLDGVRRRGEVRPGDQHPRGGRVPREVGRALVRAAGRRAQRRVTELPGRLHVRQPVLDPLERADRAAERDADLRVLGGRLQAGAHAAELLRRDRQVREVRREAERRGRVACQPGARHAVQPDPRQGPAVVQAWQRRDLKTRRPRRDLEEHRGAARDGGNEQDVSLCRVEHGRYLPGQHVAVGACRPPANVSTGSGEGRDQLAAGDARQQPGTGLPVIEPRQGARRQRPGEQR